MSIGLVGFENLPNTFIKNIEITSNNQKNMTVTVRACIHDLADGSIWSDTSEDIAKLLRVGIVFSRNQEEITALSTGKISPLSLDYMSRGLKSPRESGTNLVYTFSFAKDFPQNTENLTVFAFCFIDKEAMLASYGFSLSSDYYGPIKSEKVLENSEIPTITYAFRDGDQYWSGPVHFANNRYMAGSYHTDTPHKTLTRVLISNTKIKDMREKLQAKSSRKLAKTNYISDLIVSYNSDTDVNSLFMVNVLNVIMNNTKYGSFLNRASQVVLTEVMNRFRIKLFTIQRQRVKNVLHSNRLGTKKSKTQSIFHKKNIIKSYDNDGGMLMNNTRIEKNGSFDVVEEEFEKDITEYKKIAMISELFLDYGFGIRTFQLNDYELTEDTPGTYRYALSFQFIDPIEKFLKNILQLMKTDLSNISLYTNYFSRGRESSIDIQGIVDAYSLYYSYIYEESQSELDKMNFQNFSLLSSQTATLASIKKFEKKYKNLYSEFLKFLNFDDVKRNNSPISIAAKTSTTARISINHIFEQDIEPSNNKVSLSYMDKRDGKRLKVFSKTEYIEQTQKQVRQHFTGNPNVETKKAPKEVTAKLNDISKNSPRFFSPIMMKSKKTKIRLDNSFKVDHSLINASLFKVSPPSIVVEKTEEKKQDTEQSRFIESDQILGSGHEFVTYSETEEQYNKINPKINSSKKIDSYFSGFQKKRSFEDTLNTIGDLTEEEADELPNQLKAVVAGQSDETRDDFVVNDNDLLSHPTTKNYYEMRNFSVQTVNYIDRFQKDDNGNILLNKPIYKSMKADELNSLSKPVICVMQNYTNNKFKISDENRIPVLDSTFIMSDRDIRVPNSTENIRTTSNYNTDDLTYEFMSSNIVVQTNQPMSETVQRANDEELLNVQARRTNIGTTFGTY